MNVADEHLIARIEDDPIAQQLPTRTTFIPLRDSDLKAQLLKVFPIDDAEATEYKNFCGRLQAIFHVEHLSSLLHLEELYDELDPDSQLVDLVPMEEEQRDKLATTLIDRVSDLLFSAHYKRLSRAEIERSIDMGWQWGVQLDVDFELFDRLEIFARGYQTVVVSRRLWKNWFREEQIELPEFQRLIMAFRVKPVEEIPPRLRWLPRNRNPAKTLSHEYVYLKTFKNIPETDLEILLPGSKVRLTKLDRAKILLPTLSGAAITIYKVARGVLVLSLAFTVEKLLGWIILIVALGGYIFKSVMSYFRTKSKYQFGLTESLYLKNLDNNSGVIYRILNEAEEQELMEAILAYTFLWKHEDAAREGMTEQELDDRVEQFLIENTGVDIDFEVHDALGKLARLGLTTVNDRGHWSVRPIEEATSYLNRNWNALFEKRARAVVTGEKLADDLFTD